VVYAGVAGEGWKPWDYCAGHVIATEAGCVVESFLAPPFPPQDEPPPQHQQQRSTNTGSSSFDLYSKSIICATSARLAQEVRSIVSS
jgi:fructose-1,6-bisphosphatase/inositol monophosphatase family enzyme